MSGTLNLGKPRNKKKDCLLGINAIYTVEPAGPIDRIDQADPI
jgi:hypothetical protein